MTESRFISFPDLITDRLILRQIKLEDENEIFALRSDERVNKYLDRPIANTIDDARQHINRLNEGMANEESIAWAITLNNSDKLIGTICFWKISKEHRKAEIGYELLPGYQGKGIMQEALPIIIEYGFKKIKFHSIEAELSPENLRSVKLLEKNGFIKKTSSNDNRDPSYSVIYTLVNNKIT
jgi:ribosomal-protein-alanine N-acetyltransferase